MGSAPGTVRSPSPDLADLIQRGDTGEVLSWIRQRLNASQRDLDDLRFGNPRLLAQLRDALEQHVEGSELDRYREEWERRAQVCYSWVRRLLVAHAINRESSGSVDTVDLEQLERALGERLDALGPAPRAELLHVLMLPDFDRATGSASTGGTRRPHLRFPAPHGEPMVEVASEIR